MAMYEDDPYDPTLDNEYDTMVMERPYSPMDSPDFASVTDFSNSPRAPYSRKRNEVKTTDPWHNSVRRVIQRQPVTIGYYHTGYTPGTRIRNAVTGTYETQFFVGRREQDLFFKVVMATGEGANGAIVKDPHQLFYDCPEEYERHFGVTVPDSIKNTWNAQANLIRRQLVA